MAAAAALNVVKQISALADGPETPEMRDCLGQVVSSLAFFLEHPDCRVRLNAGRTLVKLKQGYSTDVMKLDLSRVRAAYQRCTEALECGGGDADAEELVRLLGDLLGKGPAAASADDVPTHRATSKGDGKGAAGAQGEVVLKVGDTADPKVKASILERVVAVSGVVSVTFEAKFVIVNTRTMDVSADPSFLAELLTSIRTEGLEGVTLVSSGGDGAALNGANSSSSGDCRGGPMSSDEGKHRPDSFDDDDEEGGEPGYLDDEEEEEDDDAGVGDRGFPPAGNGPVGNGMNTVSNVPVCRGGYNGASGGDGPPLGGPGGVNQWSFFAQSNFMTGRRVQEYDDDPTIAARLAKAKQREKEKKQEGTTRIGWFTSWVRGAN